MISLANGTVIRNEQDLRGFLEPLGFDCWKWQRNEIVQMICGISPDNLPDSEEEYRSIVEEIGNQVDSVSIMLSSAADYLGDDMEQENMEEAQKILREARRDIESIAEQCDRIDLPL